MTISQHQVLVIGAGVVGLSTALYLRRTGLDVTVLDPLGPAGGASFGNAGMLSPDTATPIALPGMLRKVPGWLRDPLGTARGASIVFPTRAPVAAAMGEGGPAAARPRGVRCDARAASRYPDLLA